MTKNEGALALDFILSATVCQIAVSTTDLQARLRQALQPTIAPQSPSNEAQIQKYPRPQLSTPYLTPRDATEEMIANEWSRLLGLSPVGVNDNFLESGGHSLLAVQLISRLRELFRVEITIGAFFETLTVSGIAQALRRVETTAGQVDAIAELRRQMDGMTPEALNEWLCKEEQSASSPGTD